MKLSSYISIFFLLLNHSVVVKVSAQNVPMINHYMYHEHVYNPAHAGNVSNITVGLLARQQWIGFKGAPSTQLLNAHGFVPKIKGGVGLVISNDMLGKERSINIRLSYAYKQRIGDNTFLSGGISLGVTNRFIRANDLIFEDGGDQSALNSNESNTRPNVGVGLELITKGFTIGGSVMHLDQSLNNATVFRVPRHYFAYTKYNWNASEKVAIEPSLFFRSSAFISQLDAAVNATFNKRVTVGVLYRTTDDIGMLLGVHIKKVFISYAYDFDFGILSSNQSGSHELTLIGKFGGIKPKNTFLKSPRYMN